jgi:cytochrome c biogenesis protein ResB
VFVVRQNKDEQNIINSMSYSKPHFGRWAAHMFFYLAIYSDPHQNMMAVMVTMMMVTMMMMTMMMAKTKHETCLARWRMYDVWMRLT